MNVDSSISCHLLFGLIDSIEQNKYKILFPCLLIIGIWLPGAMAQENLITPFEQDANYSASYPEVIRFYRKLDSIYPQCRLTEIGTTDAGLPLHAVILASEPGLSPTDAKEKGKLIYFVNNGIHPGEPCGIDASMMWARDLLQNDERDQVLKDAVILLIPVYNVGGALNRSAFSRANQNGPKQYGFRGNAKYLDLNRDFIKCDSKNAQAFTRLFARWKPDLFLDTHTSNGSDYQHTMTFIGTMKGRMTPSQEILLYDTIIPDLELGMKQKHWDIVPYVYARGNPREGIYAFDDSPRYSSGYAALHHALSFISEAHMLKPYAQRVGSTYDFIDQLYRTGLRYKTEIHRARKEAVQQDNRLEKHPLAFDIDPGSSDTIPFRGYEAEKRLSQLTHGELRFYDRSDPWRDSIPYFNSYQSTVQATAPSAYIIPQAWSEVIHRLQWNEVEMHRLSKDTMFYVEQYYIRDMKTVEVAYEGHYLHRDIKTERVFRPWSFRAGDWVVPASGDQLRYLIHTCEPRAPDSWMAWNFFDAVLQQKEHFSSYVFHRTAQQILRENARLKRLFEERRAADPDFASDTRAQLDFIYRHSPYYEKTHRLYPIARYRWDWEELPLTKN